jgi:hypothetical protein
MNKWLQRIFKLNHFYWFTISNIFAAQNSEIIVH